MAVVPQVQHPTPVAQQEVPIESIPVQPVHSEETVAPVKEPVPEVSVVRAPEIVESNLPVQMPPAVQYPVTEGE